MLQLPELEHGGIDLSQYWKILRKRLGLIIALPLVVGTVVGIRELMLPDLYTASSTILIRGTAPQVFGDSSGQVQSGLAGAEQNGDSDMFLNTKYQLLQTSSLALKVIGAEDLTRNDAFTGVKYQHSLLSDLKHRLLGKSGTPHARLTFSPEALVGTYLGDLQVQLVTGTQLVQITFTTRDPQLSAQLANAHVRQFIRQGVELNSQASEEAERFLQVKLGELKRKVEDSEAALNNYRRDKGIVPGLISVNGKEDIILDRLNQLSQQLQDAHLKTISLGARMALIKQGRADALPTVVDNGVVQKLKDQQATLEQQYAGMARDFKPNYPPMQALAARIADLKKAIAAEEGTVVTSIDAQYQEAVKNEQALDAELKKQKDFAMGLNDAAVRYQILARDADTNRELYNSVLKRMKDVEVTGDVHASDISIVDLAQAPGGPSSPQRMRQVTMSLMVGLLGAFGLVFLLERLDNSLKDAEQVERYLGVPALGTIPDFLSSSEGGAYSNVYALRRQAAQRELDYSREIVLSYGSYSAAGEAYRMLRTAFVLSRAGGPPKAALITSAIKGDGKTITAVNLAIMLAMTHKRVILIDADLRLPRCHDLFALDNFAGLTEVLTGTRELKDTIRTTGIEGLDILTSGEIPPNPSELLGSERMRAVLSQLEDSYDYVIIDSTPVMQTSESVLLSTFVDGVIIVARSTSPKQQVRSALSRLQYARAKVLGVVLNKTGQSHASRYYYQYYTSPTRTTTTPSSPASKSEVQTPAPWRSRPSASATGNSGTCQPESERGSDLQRSRLKPGGNVAAFAKPGDRAIANGPGHEEAAAATPQTSSTHKSSAPGNGRRTVSEPLEQTGGLVESNADLSSATETSPASESPGVSDVFAAAVDSAKDSVDRTEVSAAQSEEPATEQAPVNVPPIATATPLRHEALTHEAALDGNDTISASASGPEGANPETIDLLTHEPKAQPASVDTTESTVSSQLPTGEPFQEASVEPAASSDAVVAAPSNRALAHTTHTPWEKADATPVTAERNVDGSQRDPAEAARHEYAAVPASEPAPFDGATAQADHPSGSYTASILSTQSFSEESAMPDEQIRPPQASSNIDGMSRPMTRELDGNVFEISKESRFSGQLKFAGTVVIQGEVEGEIEATRVIIRENGIATAKISGDNVTIAGRVNGDVLARRDLEMTATGKLNGSAAAPQMRLAPGAMFRGQCTIGG
jgi:succinoglycan biosynthesis transport protein ExoP